jgi:hypothetical protein
VVEDRALHQRALHGPERGLDAGEQHVEGPDLLVGQVDTSRDVLQATPAGVDLR